MTSAIQLDLFGEIVSAKQRRVVDTLTCLRDTLPEALDVIAELRYTGPRLESSGSRADGPWNYAVCSAGVRVQPRDQMRGFHTQPRNLVPWHELRDLVGDDPRRAEITAWRDSLPELGRWRLTYRPHELWSDPKGWHVSNFCHDHVHEQWSARRRAWHLLQDLLTDTITAVSEHGQGR